MESEPAPKPQFVISAPAPGGNLFFDSSALAPQHWFGYRTHISKSRASILVSVWSAYLAVFADPDPNFFHPGSEFFPSRIQGQKDSRIRIRVK